MRFLLSGLSLLRLASALLLLVSLCLKMKLFITNVGLKKLKAEFMGRGAGLEMYCLLFTVFFVRNGVYCLQYSRTLLEYACLLIIQFELKPKCYIHLTAQPP